METALYSNMPPREAISLSFYDLYEWAKDYHKRGQFPVPAHKRFWILEYQIVQALDWKRNDANYSEGLAALVANAFIFSAVLNLPVFSHFKYQSVDSVPKTYFNAEAVLRNLSASWQMIHYQQADSSRHRKRYSEEKLAKNVAELIERFCSYIPKGLETQAIYDTTKILTDRF